MSCYLAVYVIDDSVYMLHDFIGFMKKNEKLLTKFFRDRTMNVHDLVLLISALGKR